MNLSKLFPLGLAIAVTMAFAPINPPQALAAQVSIKTVLKVAQADAHHEAIVNGWHSYNSSCKGLTPLMFSCTIQIYNKYPRVYRGRYQDLAIYGTPNTPGRASIVSRTPWYSFVQPVTQTV